MECGVLKSRLVLTLKMFLIQKALLCNFSSRTSLLKPSIQKCHVHLCDTLSESDYSNRIIALWVHFE